MLSKNVRYYGKSEPLPETIPLRAGPLTMVYEAGDLRSVSLGDHEILRRVYVAVRDQNWGTVPPSLTNVQMEIHPTSFHISYDVNNKQSDLDFFWQGILKGNDDGTITFAMKGEARSTFRRNRIGFCVLHPMTCAGFPVNIEHIDGSAEECLFPEMIAPQLFKDGHPCPVTPFENLRAISHQITPNLWATVQFDGETFEMEDQRNWTDASFKTYGTPLSQPFPVDVDVGTEIGQSITLTLRGERPITTVNTNNKGLTFSLGAVSAKKIPQLGLGVATHAQSLTVTEINRLQALCLSHLRLDLRLSDSAYEAKLRQATTEAQALDIALEIALFVTDAAQQELAELVNLLQNLKPRILRWLIFRDDEKTTSAQWVDLARKYLTVYDASAQIGAGTNLYFTELNTVRPSTEALDVVAYSLNPQVHAFDNRSLIETLAAQAETVKSARQIGGNKPIVVSPITLQPRFNPNATGPEPILKANQLPSQVDVRQMSLFGAGWTVGSLKYMLGSDIQSITYYETSGWRGVMETELGSPLPDKFQSVPGGVFPLYHVFADVGEFNRGHMMLAESNNSLIIDGLAIHHENVIRVLLANLTGELQQLTVENLGLQAQVRYLDETNVIEAMQSPEAFRGQTIPSISTTAGKLSLSLRPYAVVRIDTVTKP